MSRKPLRRPRKHTPVLVETALKRLGTRLLIARKLREMTQEDLAHFSDVSISTVRSVEDGADGVSIGNVLKIFEGLDLLEQAESLLDPQRDPQAVIYATRKIGVC